MLDSRLAGSNGIKLVDYLRASHPAIKIIILNGYGNLTTAVACIRSGAIDYLTKSADPTAIVLALNTRPGQRADPPSVSLSNKAAALQHIRRVYEDEGQSVSETVHRLKVHRRTL